MKGINYGIEFSGGRVLEYKTGKPVDLEKARSEIAGIGLAKQSCNVRTKSTPLFASKEISDEQELASTRS